jgi:hypothetical protein
MQSIFDEIVTNGNKFRCYRRDCLMLVRDKAAAAAVAIDLCWADIAEITLTKAGI